MFNENIEYTYYFLDHEILHTCKYINVCQTIAFKSKKPV